MNRVRCDLPPVTEWPNKPLLVRQGPMVSKQSSELSQQDNFQGSMPPHVIHNPEGPQASELLLESSLFIGKAYIIIRNLPGAPEEYFASKNRQFQVVVQGRFRTETSYESVYTGQVFNRSLEKLLPRWVIRLALPVLRTLQPAMEMQLEGNTSHILTPLIATAKNIGTPMISSNTYSAVVSRPGSAPCISDFEGIMEDMTIVSQGDFRDNTSRRKYFSKK